MAESRILILEGYDAHPRQGSSGGGEHRWCARKEGRRTIVEKSSIAPCEHVVHARTKAAAKKKAVQLFRGARRARKQLGSFSGSQTAAQRRFAAAAKSCRREVGGGGRNRSYLSCMKRKLTK